MQRLYGQVGQLSISCHHQLPWVECGQIAGKTHAALWSRHRLPEEEEEENALIIIQEYGAVKAIFFGKRRSSLTTLQRSQLITNGQNHVAAVGANRINIEGAQLVGQ